LSAIGSKSFRIVPDPSEPDEASELILAAVDPWEGVDCFSQERQSFPVEVRFVGSYHDMYRIVAVLT